MRVSVLHHPTPYMCHIAKEVWIQLCILRVQWRPSLPKHPYWCWLCIWSFIDLAPDPKRHLPARKVWTHPWSSHGRHAMPTKWFSKISGMFWNLLMKVSIPFQTGLKWNIWTWKSNRKQLIHWSDGFTGQMATQLSLASTLKLRSVRHGYGSIGKGDLGISGRPQSWWVGVDPSFPKLVLFKVE